MLEVWALPSRLGTRDKGVSEAAGSKGPPEKRGETFKIGAHQGCAGPSSHGQWLNFQNICKPVVKHSHC